MKCIICGKWVDWLYDNPPEEYICEQCISDGYESDLAIARAKRIHYSNELISFDRLNIAEAIIGDIEVECTGYYLSGQLWDQEIKINGHDVYGILDSDVQDMIETELIRRVKSGAIVKRCSQIEQELPDSQDPATLRLERSGLDEQLEKLEATR